jgi:hypothetical protein
LGESILGTAHSQCLLGLVPSAPILKRTSQRRLRKIAKRYTELLSKGDVEGFVRAWDERTQRWLIEIQYRASLHRAEITPSQASNDFMNQQKTIFEVLESANRLIVECGKLVDEMVGEETRSTLEGACAKAVACIYDRRLYEPVSRHSYDRRT